MFGHTDLKKNQSMDTSKPLGRQNEAFSQADKKHYLWSVDVFFFFFEGEIRKIRGSTKYIFLEGTLKSRKFKNAGFL